MAAPDIASVDDAVQHSTPGHHEDTSEVSGRRKYSVSLARPRVSYIINTASLNPIAGGQNNPYRANTYGDRADLLHNRIIPFGTAAFDEVIVAGVYKPPEDGDWDYRYVFVSPFYEDRRDALLQREQGCRLSTGDLLVIGHDDHIPEFTANELDPDGDWDILVPKRKHAITGQRLDNGEARNYMGGHILIMRREVWVSVPWVRVLPLRCWDMPMTRIWREAGFNIEFTDELTCLDLEAKENET